MSYRILEELTGKTVKNHTKDIGELVGAPDLKHDKDFIFYGKRDGKIIMVSAEPTDEDETTVTIGEVREAVEGEYRGIYNKLHNDDEQTVRKVLITYHMIRGNETAETCIDMPISVERYNELAAGCTPENKCWHEIREALVKLTELQGYDELGSWSIELTIDA
jgi:hypothetical protein